MNGKMTSLESSKAEKYHPALSDVRYSDGVSSILWSEQSYSDTMSKEPSKDVVKSMNNYDHEIKRTRIKTIIASIITVLILAIITMIVLLVALLKSKNTMKMTDMPITAPNAYSYSGTTAAAANTPIIYDVGNGGASNDSPCSSYTVVNDPTRSVNNLAQPAPCDNGPLFQTSIGGRWIRFMGTGGTTIPLQPAGLGRCGSYVSSFFNGTLPAITGTVVDSIICFLTLSGQECGLPVDSAVVNCGSFYVYFLPPVIVCNFRYCTI